MRRLIRFALLFSALSLIAATIVSGLTSVKKEAGAVDDR
jgi:hypothetical protein